MNRTDHSSFSRREQFLFAPVNPTYAAVFRIALALMLTVAFWPRGTGLRLEGYGIPGLLYFYEHILFPYWLPILVLLILFGTGLRPRLLGFILVVLLLPLPFEFGLHATRQILLFTLLFFSLLRSNARFSLWARTAGPQSLSVGPMWPIRLIQVQLSVVYGVNALAKTTPEYLSGQVLMGMSKMLPNFLVNLSDGYLHLGPLAIPVTILAIASVMTEYTLAIGFWFPRLRVATAVLGVFFHIVSKFIIRIGMLDWTCMFLYLAFFIPFDRPLIRELYEQREGHTDPNFIPGPRT
ncbi:MAG: HTTM domain-containing protein [Thermodesulfobacteriota bacterium]